MADKPLPAQQIRPRLRSRPRLGKKLLFIGMTLLLLLCLFEATLQLACLVSPKLRAFFYAGTTERIPDPILRYRPSPDWPDHDAAGFRNRQRPAHAAIVAIGDSQTYGVSVSPHHAWPQVLAKTVEGGTYNMAYGGFGPVHYLLLVEEALALKPSVIVVGFYAGNDLSDSYTSVYRYSLLDGLASPDKRVVDAVAAADRHSSLSAPWSTTHKLVMGEMRPEPYDRPTVHPAPVTPLPHVANSLPLEIGRVPVPDRATWAGSNGGPPSWLARKIKLYGGVLALTRRRTKRVGHHDRSPNWQTCRENVSGAPPDLLFPFEDEGRRTLLTPAARSLVIDRTDVRIAEGHRISLDAFVAMAGHIRGRAQLLIMLIPTKELVFYRRALGLGDLPEELTTLADSEQEMWTATKQFLDARGIKWVDALPGLRAALDRGENPYYEDWDGHPNVSGNAVLANAVAGSHLVQELVGD